MTIAMDEEPISETPSPVHPGSETSEPDDGLLAFAEVRPRLFGIAYRMLGSAAEAEDIVQDLWLRGRLPIEVSLRTRRHSWSRQRHEYVSTSPRVPIRAVKHTSAPGFLSPWTPAAIPH